MYIPYQNLEKYEDMDLPRIILSRGYSSTIQFREQLAVLKNVHKKQVSKWMLYRYVMTLRVFQGNGAE